jgi:hypothetical protein
LKFLLPALTLFVQPAPTDAEREANALVQAVAAAYERHADAAAEVKRFSAQLSFRYEFGRMHGIDGDLSRAVRAELADLLPALDNERHVRMDAIAASIDFDALVESTPGGAWLATEIVRLSGDGATRDAMLDLLDRLAENRGYRSDFYRDVVASYAEHHDEATTPPPPVPDDLELAARAHDLAAAYRQRWETWWPFVAEIGEMRGREQYVRWLLIEIMTRDLDPAVRVIYQQRIGEVANPVDAANTARVLEIFETVDFADLNAASPYAAAEAIGILHHSGDTAVLRRALELIEPAALSGAFDGPTYALLYDRVAVYEDRPQRYGSQGDCVAGRRTLHEIEAPETVDERRAEMGLNPIEEYRAQLIAMYGPDC